LCKGFDVPKTEVLESSPTPERGTFVFISLSIVTIMFAFMIGVIYYRGLKYKEPNALIVIQADDYFKDATVTVEDTTATLPHSIQKTILPDPKPDQNYICRFSVPPGIYIVRIDFQGKPIHERSAITNEYQIAYMRLTRPSDTQPATYPTKD
jgi:hypothetical protein